MCHAQLLSASDATVRFDDNKFRVAHRVELYACSGLLICSVFTRRIVSRVEFLYDAATGGEGMFSFARLSNGDRLNFAHTFSISFLGPSVSSGPSKA